MPSWVAGFAPTHSMDKAGWATFPAHSHLL